jgi:hypothetical protein
LPISGGNDDCWEKRSLEELGERTHVGGEVVYLGGQAGSRKRREAEPFKPR